jgi:hypothetical protein
MGPHGDGYFTTGKHIIVLYQNQKLVAKSLSGYNTACHCSSLVSARLL